jgi:mannobiose 2-epimerase
MTKFKWEYINYLCLFLLIIFSSCEKKSDPYSTLLSGEYWKDQALNDIIPYWTKYGQDTKSGVFFTTLDSLWQPTGDQNKYPSMISRHLFSYSVAYLISGNKDHLAIADSTVKWLLTTAWDDQYGGWFDAINGNGDPAQTTKTTFVQVYAITGLVMYYFVTHDNTVMQYIEKANALLEQKVWDSVKGGYHSMMTREWSVLAENKDFGSQITPVSGYLLYLYQATRNKKYLDQIERILDVTVKNMVDTESGWVLENFDVNWKYLPGRSDEGEINVGHNIEVAWMLLRCYLLTGKPEQLEAAKRITAKIESAGVFNSSNIWLTTTSRFWSRYGTDTYWWVQAYGNMYNQYLFHIFKKDKYIHEFQRGAAFWDSAFMDKKHGDTFFSVGLSGKNKNGLKANRFKTSYHSMEHCLINYLCLNSWVNNDPVAFHFSIHSSNDGDLLYPVLTEDENIKVSRVIVREQDRKILQFEDQVIHLPESGPTELTVVMINQPTAKDHQNKKQHTQFFGQAD